MTIEQMQLRQFPPLYVVVDDAVIISGLSKDTLKAALNDKRNPLPHLEVGNVKKIRVSAIEPYFASKEVK